MGTGGGGRRVGGIFVGELPPSILSSDLSRSSVELWIPTILLSDIGPLEYLKCNKCAEMLHNFEKGAGKN